jgi:N-acetylmuramoyl-L-alanine amidase
MAAACLALALVIAGVVVWHLSADKGLPGEDIEPPEYVQKDYLTVNEWSRPGDPLEKVNGVVIHYVGNPDTTAQANRNYFESLSSGTEGIYASSHFIVGLDGEVIQCIPLTEVSYASNDRNSDTISIEVCHPDVTGEFSPVTYDRVVELTAWLCETFRLDPATDVIRHYDVTGKECPKYYVENPAAWEQFLVDVADEQATS